MVEKISITHPKNRKGSMKRQFLHSCRLLRNNLLYKLETNSPWARNKKVGGFTPNRDYNIREEAQEQVKNIMYQEVAEFITKN